MLTVRSLIVLDRNRRRAIDCWPTRCRTRGKPLTSDLLAPLDLAFWNMESAEHPMHLGALGVFAAHSPTAGAHAADLLAGRAAAVPGLRMRIRDLWQPSPLRPTSFGSA